MAGADKDIITHLNAVLKVKLTAISQYFLHARILKAQGNVKLADYEYRASIDIMKHSDMLVEHILALGGSPDLQELCKLAIGDTAANMMQNDLALSQMALAQLKEAIACSERTSSPATAAMLRKICDSQLEHIDFINNQLNAEKTHGKDAA